jgi:predicted XRE-type DNA-binding protein
MRKSGEDHPNARLTTRLVQSIRKMYYCNNMMQKEIGGLYNLPQPTISDVVTYKSWAHVPDTFRADEITRLTN